MADVEILLVEDNADDLEMALFAFREANVANTIHTARDGQEALDFIFAEGEFSSRKDSQVPLVILLDLKLPKVDGFDVLRRLKSAPEKRMIPVIMLTSSHEQRDLIESYNLGVNSYIVKPVKFEEFVRVIKELGCYWLILNQQAR
ncbi:MAG: response regulator [Spirochaetes bacterium]|nr:response regulator [Spirochaetota bacterium]